MKRIFALIISLVLALSLVACGDEGGKNNNSNGNNDAINEVSYYIVYNSTKIELGADAKPILEAIGAAQSESEMGACGDQGTVTKYVYDNFELFVLKNGDKATVDQITLKNDLIRTAEGIAIGMLMGEVTNVYGEGYAKRTDNEIRYTNGNKNLKFQIRDGAVVGIDYMVLG